MAENEYIEREKIWPALNVACVPYNRATAKAIENIPAADVAPVRHGRWMEKADGKCYWYVCSECGSKPPKDQWEYQWLSPYCPYCGAKMDGGET